MEFTGLAIGRYKKNRLISDDEKADRLVQGRRLDVEPTCQLSVIKINSTYLESVDRFFGGRGVLTLGASVAIVFSVVAIVTMGGLILHRYRAGLEDAATTFTSLAVILFISGPFAIWAYWIARRELFRLTHYPIRLNRRNGMLYVHRLDGSILSVPWGSVFFTLSPCSAMYGKTWDIRGLVLNVGGNTVKKEFAFSMWSTDKDDLRSHWEFLRRYMEEGPSAVLGQIEFCMPVDGKRESFRSGLERVFAPYAGHLFFFWMMLPFNLAVACRRWIVMRTCKIPIWPEDIESACRIEEGDPYVRDARINPPNLR